MTHGALRLEIPVLQPDEAFVRRLAELAAASTPSSGVVVPVSFGGPTGRALAAAAAVAAITAGAAAAASQITHSHDSPAPPISTGGTQVPTSPSSSDSPDSGRTDPPVSGHEPASQAVAADTTTSTQDPQAFHTTRTQDSSESGPGPSDPDETVEPGEEAEPGDNSGPSDDGSDHSGPGDGSTSTGSDGSSDGASDSTSGGDGGSDGGSTSSDEGTSGSGGTTVSPGGESSRRLAGSGD